MFVIRLLIHDHYRLSDFIISFVGKRRVGIIMPCSHDFNILVSEVAK